MHTSGICLHYRLFPWRDLFSCEVDRSCLVLFKGVFVLEESQANCPAVYWLHAKLSILVGCPKWNTCVLNTYYFECISAQSVLTLRSKRKCSVLFGTQNNPKIECGWLILHTLNKCHISDGAEVVLATRHYHVLLCVLHWNVPYSRIITDSGTLQLRCVLFINIHPIDRKPVGN